MASTPPQADAIARRYGIDPGIFRALIRQESGGDPNARSPVGAIGYTQLMPGTAAGLHVNPRDPVQNLEGGAKYLRQQLDHFGGSYKKALAAYNAGPGAVEKYGGVPPYAETQNYVRTILANAGAPGPTARVTGRQPTTSAAAGGSRRTRTVTTPGTDNSQARRQALAAFLLDGGTTDPTTGLTSGGGDILQFALNMRALKDTPSTTRTVTAPAASRSRAAASGSRQAAPASTGGGRVVINGKPVTADLARVVALARRYGWGGQVTSGIRTRSQQLAAAQHFGLQHYGPAGPLGSNHVEGHPGAIDVSDPNGFEAALQRARAAGYRGRLPFRGMKDDPVHFSWSGH